MVDNGDACDNANAYEELILSYHDNRSAVEEAALKFLGTDIGLDHMPLINVPTLRDLVKGDFWILLRRAKARFIDPIENALFLVVLTDYVTCAVRNVKLFDIFHKIKDESRGIPCLLTYIDGQWNRLFCLLNTPSDMSVEQLRSLISLFKRSVNRLPTKLYRDCFYQSLNAGTQQLYFANLAEKPMKNKTNKQNQSNDDQLSYTSIKNCETPKYSLDSSLKELYFSHKLLSHEPVESKQSIVAKSKVMKSMSTTSNNATDNPATTVVPPQQDIPKPKKKKFSSDIMKYMCNIEKKDPVNTTSLPEVVKKTILEATSKENVLVLEPDKRAITPPFSAVPEEPAKSSLVTPDDQPTIINLCSPIKSMPGSDSTQVPVTANGKKNAFAIMMMRSKENSKRKALFPPGRGRKV